MNVQNINDSKNIPKRYFSLFLSAKKRSAMSSTIFEYLNSHPNIYAKPSKDKQNQGKTGKASKG